MASTLTMAWLMDKYGDKIHIENVNFASPKTLSVKSAKKFDSFRARYKNYNTQYHHDGDPVPQLLQTYAHTDGGIRLSRHYDFITGKEYGGAKHNEHRPSDFSFLWNAPREAIRDILGYDNGYHSLTHYIKTLKAHHSGKALPSESTIREIIKALSRTKKDDTEL